MSLNLKFFKTMNSFRLTSLSLKYHRLKPPGCKDIGIRKFGFVAKIPLSLAKGDKFLNFYGL